MALSACRWPPLGSGRLVEHVDGQDHGRGARESYSMLTINADAHPLMSRMHKPDPKKLAVDKQDKRSVIPLEADDYDQWLTGTVGAAQALLRLSPVGLFDAGPA